MTRFIHFYTENGAQLVSNQATAQAILKRATQMTVSADAFLQILLIGLLLSNENGA